MNFKNIIITAIVITLFTSSQFTYSQFGERAAQIKAYNSTDKVYAGTESKIAIMVNINDGWHINSDKPKEDFLIPSKLTIDSTKGFEVNKIVYPKPIEVNLSFSDKPLSVWEGEIYIGAIIEISKDMAPGKYNLPIQLEYQSCNNQTCLPPMYAKDTLAIEIVSKSASISEINQNIFDKIELSIRSTKTNNIGKENSIGSVLEHSGLLLSLIFVFLGGLALNLTPCVYPLIPITIGFFGGQSEGSTKKLFMMGILFVVGMAITYSVIGVVTALSGAVFGSLLQNMFVIIFIAAVFVVLSLSMFGVYEFQLPNSIVAKAGGAKSGYYGAFFMGLTMGIVAAPCIGPFVLGLVTLVAAKADPFYGFLMFFVLAVGLGMPYLVLAVFSGKIKKLPKSGEWMEAVKHIFGFILLGMAIYFLLPLLPKSISGYALPIFMIITGLYLLIFEKYGNKIKGFKIFKIVFSVIILGYAFYTLVPSQKAEIKWESYTANTSLAELGSSKGMIIDFYADWCIPCKELDASTFKDPKVVNSSKDFLTFKANMTKSLSPEVEALRHKYDIIGVPTVLIVDSKGHEVKRITGYIDSSEFLKILNSVE